ncbi:MULTISPECIES: thiamine phosphate synthase [Bacillota]|jgi:thiamine-phosphate pyrophosphorylase|uniref:Thiamine-phosphate synthase n=2 Tax=Amedibacillus TaxID=2749846 RepID=A0A7G9GSY8_9FIRM|nr:MULTISPECIES: thiamine phosphate synthase [Bacillota]QNM13920.1 thiamine phosphate synthase [[Eubacterium] hominis]MCH4283953.1 thiamine phosphate synthase [Amedibacillus hominis]RGB56833.1 thiamine phosphate synthase [Absiella sp. AM22-9]RGB60727.1 thiamine phosphate synthase [Absiella sp. AM10-20]RGB69260.1 thiamine phosphate synthase [Absiella sp. AM09-45]
MSKLDLTLYLVTDSTNMTEDEFLSKVEAACRGGVTLIQLREKNRTTKEYIDLANKVKAISDRYDLPLLIDDRLDVAMAVDAAGVHVGADDMPVALARKLLGPDKIVGATAKTVEAAMIAQADGADYLGVGAIYPTTTKVKTVLTKVETLQDICEHVSIPVGAIGGLNKDNCDILKGTDIDGLCVVSAIMKQDDCETAARELKAKIQSILK